MSSMSYKTQLVVGSWVRGGLDTLDRKGKRRTKDNYSFICRKVGIRDRGIEGKA